MTAQRSRGNYKRRATEHNAVRELASCFCACRINETLFSAELSPKHSKPLAPGTDLHAAVTDAADRDLEGMRDRSRTRRFTHVYPTAWLLTTASMPAGAGVARRAVDEIKAAVSEAISASGGTITHHHVPNATTALAATGASDLLRHLRGGEAALDPAGIPNPGCCSVADQPIQPQQPRPGWPT